MRKLGRTGVCVALVALLASSLACTYSGPQRIRVWRWEYVRGSGVVAEESRNVSDFDRVILSGVAQLYVEQGNEVAVRIEAEDNLMRYIETDVEDRTLEISTNRHGSRLVGVRPTRPIRIYLETKDLKEIVVSGVATVEVGDLQSDRLSVDISGGGDLDISALTADTLDVAISGLGNLNIRGGSVSTQRIGISGGANYNARSLESARTEVSVNGLGSVTVWANDRLDVTISGGGTVTYDGTPQVHQDVSGLGRVEAAGG